MDRSIGAGPRDRRPECPVGGNARTDDCPQDPSGAHRIEDPKRPCPNGVESRDLRGQTSP